MPAQGSGMCGEEAVRDKERAGGGLDHGWEDREWEVGPGSRMPDPSPIPGEPVAVLGFLDLYYLIR